MPDNLAGTLKTAEVQARGSLRTAIGNKPFTWLAIAAGFGAAVGLALGVFVL